MTAVGAVLTVPDATGTYASWAYAWALVAPGGVGAGLLLYGTLTRRGDIAWGGLASLLAGIVLFLVGFLFFEGILQLDGSRFGNLTDVAVPIVIMGIGAVIVVGGRAFRPLATAVVGGITGAPADSVGAGWWDRPGCCQAGRSGARSSSQLLDLPLDGAGDAEIRISFGAGTLVVGPAASGRLVDGSFEGGVDATPAGPGRVRLATPHSGPWSWSCGSAPLRVARRPHGGGAAPPGAGDRCIGQTGWTWRTCASRTSASGPGRPSRG